MEKIANHTSHSADMTYVSPMWMLPRIQQEAAQEEQIRQWNMVARQRVSGNAHTRVRPYKESRTKNTKGKEPAVYKKAKETKKRFRPHKCWYCNERHVHLNSACPPERRNIWHWRKQSKPNRRFREMKARSTGFMGKKIVFD